MAHHQPWLHVAPHNQNAQFVHLGTDNVIHPIAQPNRLAAIGHQNGVIFNGLEDAYHPEFNDHNRNNVLNALEAVLRSHNSWNIRGRLWDVTRQLNEAEQATANDFQLGQPMVPAYQAVDGYLLARGGRDVDIRPPNATLQAMAVLQAAHPMDQPCLNTTEKLPMAEGSVGYENRQITAETTLYQTYDALVRHCGDILACINPDDVHDNREQVLPNLIIDEIGDQGLRTMCLMIMPEVICTLSEPVNPHH